MGADSKPELFAFSLAQLTMPLAASTWQTEAPAQVFQHVDTLRSAGLAVPETVALLYELKQEGFDVPLDAISDEACAQVLADLLKKPPHLGGE